MRRQAIGFALAAAVLVTAPRVEASPWVLRKGALVVGLTATAQLARNEFRADSGKRQAYPLDGRVESYGIELSGRYGLGYNVEISVRTELKGISFVSDPVLLPGSANLQTLADYRGRVFNFSDSAIGLSDIYFGVTYGILRGTFRMSSYLEIKVPTGYRAPRATFEEDQADPEQVTDDVTLGDGQVDIMGQLQFGYIIRATRTLFELDVGYKARFNGPGHQAVGAFKIGQIFGRLLLYASAEGAYTLFKGSVIGTTFVAVDPKVPATQYTGANIEGIDYRLDRDFLTVGGGAILRFGRKEFVLRIAHTPLGRNYAALTAISLGLLVTFG